MPDVESLKQIIVYLLMTATLGFAAWLPLVRVTFERSVAAAPCRQTMRARNSRA